MPLVKWKPEFSLGIASVDHDHQEMIELINQAYDKVEDPTSVDDVELLLGDIHACIAAHFALEESLMRKAGFSEYEAHKDDHEELLDQIRDLMDDFVDNPTSGRELLEQKLSDWFTAHFASFDARLHHQLPH